MSDLGWYLSFEVCVSGVRSLLFGCVWKGVVECGGGVEGGFG